MWLLGYVLEYLLKAYGLHNFGITFLNKNSDAFKKKENVT